MPTLDQIINAEQQATIDALNTAAAAFGASSLAQLIGWLATTSVLDGQSNFANPNASGLLAAVSGSRDAYRGKLY